MNSITKSIHPMYRESVVLSIPENDLHNEGITHFRTLARLHYEKDYHKQPTQVEVIKEDGITHVVARCDNN